MADWAEWLLAIGILCFWAFVWYWTKDVEDDDEHYGDFVC